MRGGKFAFAFSNQNCSQILRKGLVSATGFWGLLSLSIYNVKDGGKGAWITLILQIVEESADTSR